MSGIADHIKAVRAVTNRGPAASLGDGADVGGVVMSTLAAVAALAMALPALAQDLLTLEAAVAQAVTKNPGLQAAGAGADEAAARVDQAQSRFFPG